MRQVAGKTFGAAAHVGLAVLMCLSAAGCISLPSESSFSVMQSGDRLSLELYVTRPALHTNLHRGNSKRYSLSIPRGKSLVMAEEISVVAEDGKGVPMLLVKGGFLEIDLNADGCRLKVELVGADCTPAALNGRYNMRHCGQDALRPVP